MLELMEPDIVIVNDENYISAVSEILYHPGAFDGAVYQLEGLLTVDGDSVILSRNLVHGDETRTLDVSLRYLEKEIPNGVWARVTCIVASVEADGNAASVLDIVAIETLPQAGRLNLDWDGESTHHH